MYRGLTAKNSRLCRVQPPGAAPEPSNFEDSSVFPIPPQPAQRAADKERRFRARAASGPRLPSCSRDGFPTRHNRLSGPSRPDMRIAGERFGAGLSATDKGGALPPTFLDGPTLDAPDCVADQDPRKNRADAERKLRASPCSARIRLGRAPRVAFWPSPHPRIRWTVASSGRAKSASRPPRPPPSRVPKCPTRCLSMPPTRRRPGSSWSAAIASKSLISRPHNENNYAATSTSPRSRALSRRCRRPLSSMAATAMASWPSAKFIRTITRSRLPTVRH